MEAFIARQFAKAKSEPNTFIGGIAKQGGTGVNAPIDTPYKLSQKLGINVNRITGFKVIGDDVECRIKGTYSLPASCFGNSTAVDANKNITSYIDDENLCTGGGSSVFANCTELVSVKLLSWSSFLNFQFHNCTKLENIQLTWSNFVTITAQNVFSNTRLGGELNLTNTTSITGYQVLSNTRITKLNAPVLTNGGSSLAFSSNLLLKEVYVPLLTSGLGFFQGCVELEKITLGAMTNVPNSFAQNCSKLNEVIGIGNFTLLGSNSFAGNKIPEFIANNVTSCGNTAFQGATMNLIEMKKCKSLGSLTNGNIFNLVNSGFTIRVNIDLRTIDGGDAHLSLINAKNLKSAIVEFYDDNGDYVSTL